MFKNNINLNLYKTFYDVVRYGSFSKAAELTFSTQPAISKAIKKLESELETKVFIRNPNGVELTDKGKELLYYVEKSFGNLLTAERILLENDQLNRGKISIGLPSNLSFIVLDNIIAFNNKYPNIEITIINGNTTYLLDLLELHKIDFIIDTAPIIQTNNNLIIKNIKELDNCFICNKDYDITNINTIKDLNNHKLILPIPESNNREELNEVLINNEINTNIINAYSSEIIKSFVDKNVGIGYILYDFIKEDKNIKIINIKEELPKSKIILAYDKKFLTNAPKKFIEEYITDMN